MMMIRMVFISSVLLLVSACSPVKTIISNQYQLSAFSSKKMALKPRAITLYVTAPEAVAGYQTEQMRYIKKPFRLDTFAKNAWSSPPADMLYPLIVRSIQKTHAFSAVTSGSFSDEADYRLDTQLLSLEQNFMKKPSVLEFSAKIEITRVSDSQVVGSQIFNASIPCPQDTPYGGVIAANKAVWQFTKNVAAFVVSHT